MTKSLAIRQYKKRQLANDTINMAEETEYMPVPDSLRKE